MLDLPSSERVGAHKGAVAELAGIESGVVSGVSTQNDSGVSAPVEATPWAATRSQMRCIRPVTQAPRSDVPHLGPCARG